MDDSRTSDGKTFKGYWWLPSKPEQRWFGNLNWKQSESPDLELDYKSAEEVAPPSDQVESFWGLDAHGTPVSVLRAGWVGGKSSEFLSKWRYHAGHVLRGIHVGSLDEFRANKINVWIGHLSDWISEEGFGKTDGSDGAWRIEYRRPEDRSFKISNNTTLKLCHSASATLGGRKRAIGYDIFVSLERERPFGFAAAFRWIDALRKLLHFACLRPIKPTQITF